MKKLLSLLLLALMLSGCIAVPVYDTGYYYGPRPYYVGPEVSVFFPGFYGGYHGGHGYRGWRR